MWNAGTEERGWFAISAVRIEDKNRLRDLSYYLRFWSFLHCFSWAEIQRCWNGKEPCSGGYSQCWGAAGQGCDAQRDSQAHQAGHQEGSPSSSTPLCFSLKSPDKYWLNTGNTQKSAETKEAKDFRVLTQAMGSSLLRQKKINGSKFGEENLTTTVGQSPITLSSSFMPFPFSEHL